MATTKFDIASTSDFPPINGDLLGCRYAGYPQQIIIGGSAKVHLGDEYRCDQRIGHGVSREQTCEYLEATVVTLNFVALTQKLVKKSWKSIGKEDIATFLQLAGNAIRRSISEIGIILVRLHGFSSPSCKHLSDTLAMTCDIAIRLENGLRDLNNGDHFQGLTDPEPVVERLFQEVGIDRPELLQNLILKTFTCILLYVEYVSYVLVSRSTI